MSDQPILIPIQASIEGSGGVISELQNMKKVVGDLAEMDVSGKLKTQVQVIQTSLESLTQSLVSNVGAQAKAMADAAANGANGAVGAVKRARQEMQAEYEKMAASGKTFDLGELLSLKTQGTQLFPSHIAALTEGLNTSKLETEVTKYSERMQLLGEKVADTQRRADNWFNAAVSKMEKDALAEQLKEKSAREAKAAEEYAASIDILNARVKAAKVRQQEALDTTLMGIKGQSKQMWADKKAEEIAESESYAATLDILNAKIKAAKVRQQEALDSTLNSLKNQSKQMWADKKAQETADAEAYVRTLDVLNAQIKAAKARQQEALDQQMGVLARTARAQFNKALSTAGNYSVSEGSGIGLEKNTADADTAQKGLNASQKEGATAAAALRAEKAKLSEEMRNMHSAARGLASGFGAMWLTWGNVLPLMAGAGISGAVANMIKSGSEVQQQLTAMRVLGGESAESVSALNAQMLEMAKNGPYGPKETAAAMKTLVLAGMDAKDVAVSLKDVLNFSVAGDTGIQQAADTLTTVATAFGLGKGKSGMAGAFTYVGDIISVAAAESKASVEDMSNSFKTASAINQQFGVSLEDTAVGLALLANAGIKGTAAGTSLRNMVSDLSGRTKKATDAMKELGVEAIDPTTGKIKSLDVVMGSLLTKLQQKESPTGAMKYLQTIFDERGAKEAFAMFEALQTKAKETKVGIEDAYAELKDKVANAAGFSAIAAAEMALTPMNEMKSVVATLEGTLVDVFNTLKPYLIETAERLKEIFASDKFKSGLQDLITGVGTLVTTLIEHGKALLTVIAGYAALKGVSMVILEMRAAYVALTVAAEGAAAATGALGVATRLATASNPLLLALTAAITAAAGGFMLYEMYMGQSTKATEDSETPRKAMIKSLEAERDRLREINEARAENVTVEELRARKAAGPSGDTGLERQIAEAKKRLDNAKLVNKPAEAEAQAAYDALVNKANGDRQALIRARYQVMAEAGRIADDQRADQKKRMEEQAARFKGSGKGPTESTGSSNTFSLHPDNTLANLKKQYDSEMSVITEEEASKSKVLNAYKSANLVTSSLFYAQEIALAEQTESRKEQITQDARQKYADQLVQQMDDMKSAFDKWKITPGKKGQLPSSEEIEKGQEKLNSELLNVANTAGSVFAQFDANDKKAKDNALTRMTLQAISLQGALKKAKDGFDDYSRSQAAADAKKARDDKTEDSLRFVSPREAIALKAQADELERVGDAVRAYDADIAKLNKDLEDNADAVYAMGPPTADQVQAYDQSTKAIKAQVDALKALKDARAGTAQGRALKAGDDALAKADKDALKPVADNFRKILSDNIRSGFKDGENFGSVFAKTLGDTIEQRFTQGLLDSLVNPAVNLAMTVFTQLLKDGMSLLSGGGFGKTGDVISSAWSWLTSANGNAFTGGGVHAFANGGAFTNQIVNSPTLFKFANGTGMMGEAGPEAIMPLTRGPGGKLGVQATGAGGGNSMVVNIIESSEKGGKVERRTEDGVDVLDVFVEKVKSAIANDINRGSGAVPNALSRTYALNRAAGSY